MSESGTRQQAPAPLRARRVPSRAVWIAIAAAIIALLAIVAYGAYSVTVSNDVAQQLDRAQELIDQADIVVVEVDTVVRSEVTTQLATQADEAQSRVPGAVSRLKQAMELIDATPIPAIAPTSRAADLRASAQARIHMLSHAPELLTLNRQASIALVAGRSGWDALVRADKLSDEAVAQYNKLTRAGVEQSRALNRQAAKDLATARSAFADAEKAFSAAAFEQFLAYAEARIELNRLSQASDKAWLDDDISAANRASSQYNAADKRAVELAKSLPASPEQAVADAYEAAAKSVTDQYNAARQEAIEADGRLRGR